MPSLPESFRELMESSDNERSDNQPLVGGAGTVQLASSSRARGWNAAGAALLVAGVVLVLGTAGGAGSGVSASLRKPEALVTLDASQPEFDTLDEDRSLVVLEKVDQDFYVGQKVNVRDSEKDEWKEGTVTSLLPLSVKPDGWEDSFSWSHIQTGGVDVSKDGGVSQAHQVLAKGLQQAAKHAQRGDAHKASADGDENPLAMGLAKGLAHLLQSEKREASTTHEAKAKAHEAKAKATTTHKAKAHKATKSTTAAPTSTTTPLPTTTTEEPSCSTGEHKYGCTGEYMPAHRCQCNLDCLNHGNCCHDYGDECKAEDEAKTTTAPTTTPHTTTTVAMLEGPGGVKVQAPTLFCWLVVRTHGYEPDLVKEQYKQGVHVFGCDDYTVFSNAPLLLGPDNGGRFMSAMIIISPHVDMGHWGQNGQTTNSWLNTMNFMNAWEMLRADGRVWHHDWTVKADPDAVLIPDRLRQVVLPNTPKEGECTFILNCGIQPGNPLLYGAIEVFSKKAVGLYLDNGQKCKNDLDWDGWGEDYFMQQCLQKLGANRTIHTDMVSDSNCHAVACTDHSRAAYHPFKDTKSWFDCWGQATEVIR